MNELGIDWNNIHERFKKKYYLNEIGDEREKVKYEAKWKNASFIFAPNICIEIEKCIERVFI